MTTLSFSDQTDSLQQYLESIGQWPLLSKEQEQSLNSQIKAGQAAEHKLKHNTNLSEEEANQLKHVIARGSAAKQYFIQCNLRLVVNIAKRYSRTGVPLLDVIQEGNIGLFKAVDKFDSDKGFKFSTYATWWIKHTIQKGISEHVHSIRLPREAHDEWKRLHMMKSTLETQLHHSPNVSELAHALQSSPDRVQQLLTMGTDPLSLDEPVTHDANATTLMDYLADTQPDAYTILAQQMVSETIKGLLSQLTSDAQIVLAMRFGLNPYPRPLSWKEIARSQHRTVDSIRSIYRRGADQFVQMADQLGVRELLEDYTAPEAFAR